MIDITTIELTTEERFSLLLAIDVYVKNQKQIIEDFQISEGDTAYYIVDDVKRLESIFNRLMGVKK